MEAMAPWTPEPAFADGSITSLRCKVRCACQHCGAHVMAHVSWRVAGQCMNCGSFDLAMLAGSAPSP